MIRESLELIPPFLGLKDIKEILELRENLESQEYLGSLELEELEISLVDEELQETREEKVILVCQALWVTKVQTDHRELQEVKVLKVKKEGKD